jgi:hypothetical protein
MGKTIEIGHNKTMSPQTNRTASWTITGLDPFEFTTLVENFIEIYTNGYYHFNYLFFEGGGRTATPFVSFSK